MLQRADRRQDVRQHRAIPAARAEIGGQRRAKIISVRFQQPDRALQTPDPHFRGGHRRLRQRVALPGENIICALGHCASNLRP
jgi:hypothetical protein